ncbi:MAG TPA: hypothetical protein PK765_01745 [bacterium]|nr:hypothetical protein [bacterium]
MKSPFFRDGPRAVVTAAYIGLSATSALAGDMHRIERVSEHFSGRIGDALTEESISMRARINRANENRPAAEPGIFEVRPMTRRVGPREDYDKLEAQTTSPQSPETERSGGLFGWLGL